MDVELRIREASRQIIEKYFPHEVAYFDVVWGALRHAAIEQAGSGTVFQEESNLGLTGSSRDWALPIVIRTLRCVSAVLPLPNAAIFAEQQVTEVARKCAEKYRAPGYLIEHLADEVFPLLYQWPYAPELANPLEEIFEVVIRKREELPKIVPKTFAEVEHLTLTATKDFDLFINLSSSACPFHGGSAVAGVQERQKKLLAYLLTHAGRRRTVEDIWNAVWSKNPSSSGASNLEDPPNKKERIEKQLRVLRNHFQRINVDLGIELFRGTYRFCGNQSFCVIPPKPIVRSSR